MIKLLVGLGNPGQKYTKTRHNAGFLLLDKLAREMSVAFSSQTKFFGGLAEIKIEKGGVYLLKPHTFMNRSGQSVSALMKYYKIKPEERVPERPKGSDCKSDGSAFGGSNPPPSTIRERSRFGGEWTGVADIQTNGRV